MSGFLASLIARASPQAMRLERRRPALFEQPGVRAEPAAVDDGEHPTASPDVHTTSPWTTPAVDIVRPTSSRLAERPEPVDRIAVDPPAGRLVQPEQAGPRLLPTERLPSEPPRRRPEPLPGGTWHAGPRAIPAAVAAEKEPGVRARVDSAPPGPVRSGFDADLAPARTTVRSQPVRDDTPALLRPTSAPPIPQATQLAKAAKARLEPAGAPPAAVPQKTVQITIGRVEVRAVAATERAAPRAPQKPASRLSLDDYLRDRGGGSR